MKTQKNTPPVNKHQLEITDPNTGRVGLLSLTEEPTFDELTSTLHFNIKKVSVKSDFLVNLARIENYSKAGAKLRKQAVEARPLLNDLLVDIRIDEDNPGPPPSYIFSTISPDKIGKLRVVDAALYQTRDQLKLDLVAAEKQGSGPDIFRINSELMQVEQQIKEAHAAYDNKQDLLIEQIVTNLLSYDASRIALWLVDPTISLDAALLRLKGDKAAKASVSAKKATFRRSGHSIDQSLEYEKADFNPDETFNRLPLSIQQKLTSAGVERTKVVRGIRLTASEQKVIDGLGRLLGDKSQNSNAKKRDFYSGNEPTQLMVFGDNGKVEIAPHLNITLYELTKIFKGGEYVSGKDIRNVWDIIEQLEKRKFLIDYIEKTPRKGGGYNEVTITDFIPLIKVVTQKEREVDNAGVELRAKESIVIMLNPIFRHQIDTKYIEYPSDITQRTLIAAGTNLKNVTPYRLRDYLMRERSSKRYEPEINEDTLLRMLNDKFVNEGRKGRVKRDADEAIEIMKRLGLLLKHEVKVGAEGQAKYIFYLNKDWE